MDHYNHNVDLPFSKIKLNFREINTEEQLLIAKANLSMGDRNSVFEYHNYVFNVIKNCVKEKDLFPNINIIEYVLFLTKLRTISIGPTIDFILNNDSEKKTKIKIDLREYLMELYKASDYFTQEENTLLEDGILKFELGWPSVDSVKSFYDLSNVKKNEYFILDDSLCEFIKKVTLNDYIFDTEKLNFEEKTKFLDKIPVSSKLKIQTKVVNACKKLFETDVFKISFFSDYKFNLYNLSFIEHIKMLFSYDLKSLYSEVFYLANHNLNPEYVMKISNSERKLYMTIISEQNQKKDEQNDPNMSQKTNNQTGYSNDVQKMALEFGQDLSK